MYVLIFILAGHGRLLCEWDGEKTKVYNIVEVKGNPTVLRVPMPYRCMVRDKTLYIHGVQLGSDSQ